MRRPSAARTLTRVTVFLPLVLVGPAVILLDAVLRLAAHGPLGWVAAAGLLAAVFWTARALVRAARTWWASTKAPERVPPLRS